jgi:hypothetical protein
MPSPKDGPFGLSLDAGARSGLVIGERFEIQEKVGSGGMGTVYRALDIQRGVFVALKLARGQADLERFLREATALASVSHPRVVRYVAHGVLDGAMYLAMEWLAGEDLSVRLERGRLDVDQALVVGRAAADALAALHERGLVHRDVKPSNLFLEGGKLEGLKLLDFGIARSMRERVHLTQTGQALGTPSYMAPEQARGDERIDARADVFALGCVLFECLTGRPPFTGDHPVAVLAKLLIQDAPRLAELRPGAPRGLDGLLSRMLSKEPEGRPANGAAILAELDRVDRTPSAPPFAEGANPGAGDGRAADPLRGAVAPRGWAGSDDGAVAEHARGGAGARRRDAAGRAAGAPRERVAACRRPRRGVARGSRGARGAVRAHDGRVGAVDARGAGDGARHRRRAAAGGRRRRSGGEDARRGRRAARRRADRRGHGEPPRRAVRRAARGRRPVPLRRARHRGGAAHAPREADVVRRA